MIGADPSVGTRYPVPSKNLIRADLLVISIAWTIACFHGDGEQRGSPDRAKRTPNPTALLLEAIAVLPINSLEQINSHISTLLRIDFLKELRNAALKSSIWAPVE